MQEPDKTTVVNLTEAAKTAQTKREQAWLLLKQTRNPEYVSARYGYPVATMRKALEKLPDVIPPKKKKGNSLARNSAAPGRSTFKRPGELLPTIARSEKPPGES